MTQTANNQSNTAQRKPGQRQQERLMRLARRRKRQQIWASVIVALVLIGFGIFGLVQYQGYTAHQQTLAAAATSTADVKANTQATANTNASATAGVQASATAISQALLTATSGSPIPTSGPAKPPAVSGTPVKLAGGLQYIDVKQGSGPAAVAGSTVQVEYTGWLQSNGKKFDSSYDHGGQPFAVTPLGQAQIIPGWNEGLVGVKAGGVRRLIIPPALGYGAQGSPPVIPANATLIFDVTIVSVQNPS